ncbi:MAG: hypothetical protein ABSB50_20590 [Terracidiphilus sp.]|jgi:hypothetical protein
MTRTSSEFKEFNAAMDTILKADPARVKTEVDAEIQANKAERDAKGERKRGRKPMPFKQGSVVERADE